MRAYVQVGGSDSYTSCRNLKVASSLGTLVNWFPSRYLEEKKNRILIQMIESIMSKSQQIKTKTLGLPLQETKT